MIRRRKIFESLSRGRLLDVAKEFGIVGLSGKSKDAVVDALTAERLPKTTELLAALSRDELKEVCRAAGLDDSGREKSQIISRLLGQAGEAAVAEPRRRLLESRPIPQGNAMDDSDTPPPEDETPESFASSSEPPSPSAPPRQPGRSRDRRTPQVSGRQTGYRTVRA